MPAFWIDQGQVRATRIGQEPDGGLTPGSPIVDETKPLVAVRWLYHG